MAILLLEADPFVTHLDTLLDPSSPMYVRNARDVRRPTMGVIPFDNREDFYAFLSVTVEDEDKKPVNLKLLDQGSGTGTTQRWGNFLVQSVQERRLEKAQIVQTFGDNHYFFFGSEPKFLMVSGVVLMTEDFNWANEFRYNYENYFRGSRCAELQARVHFAFSTMTIQGFMASMAMDFSAQDPNIVPITFNMAVTAFQDTTTGNIDDIQRGGSSVPASYYEFKGKSKDSTLINYADIVGEFVQKAPPAVSAGTGTGVGSTTPSSAAGCHSALGVPDSVQSPTASASSSPSCDSAPVP